MSGSVQTYVGGWQAPSKQEMIIEKPYWIWGLGAIHSIHVHPDGTRFVTGGDDPIVRVYSLRVLSHNHKPAHADAQRS